MKAEHILQSAEWEKVEKAEGKKTFFVEAPGFWARGTIEKTPVMPYLFMKYGPECKDEKSFLSGMRKVEKLAKKEGAGFVRVEPRNLEVKKALRSCGYVKTRNIEPEWTLVLPLESEEQVLGAIEGRKVRYWRNYQKKGMKIWSSKEVSDTKILYELLTKLADKDKFRAYSLEHLENEVRQGFATLYFISLEEQKKVIAAAMVYDDEKTRYYVHAAKDESQAKLMAGTILLIQMIIDAYREGKKRFDFWGMTKSEDRNHPWYGFTQYKKSFGGVETEFSGTWDLVLKPVRYQIYRALRAANLKLRKKK